MTLSFLSDSKNCCKLFEVFSEVFVLHGWIHWVAKSCTTITYRWLFRDSQFSIKTLWFAVIQSPKNFSTMYGFVIASSAWNTCNLESLYRSRNFGFSGNEYKQNLRKFTRVLSMDSKDDSCQKLACEFVCSGTWSTKFYLNSRSHSSTSKCNRSHGSVLWYKKSSRSFNSTCSLDTDTGWEFVPLRFSRTRVSLSLATDVVGEVHKFEEQVRWSCSCHEGVIEVEKRELESIHRKTRFHRKAFWATILLACYRGPSLSRIYRTLWQTQLMRLHFSIGGYDCCRTTRFRQNIHYSITLVLFVVNMHRRSGVDNKFSFLRFRSWCGQAPIFWRWKECCSFMLLYF